MDKRTKTKHIWNFVTDTSEEMFHKQQEFWMRNPVEKRLEMTLAFTDSAFELNKTNLRNQNPSWTEREIEIEQFKQVYKNEFSSEILEKIIEFLKDKK